MEEENLSLTKAQIEKALGSPPDLENKITGYTAIVKAELSGSEFKEIIKDLFVKKKYEKAYIMNILRPLAEGK